MLARLWMRLLVSSYCKFICVQTLIHYLVPPHQQECYLTSEELKVNSEGLPITEKIHQQELSIPMNQVLTMEEAEEVVKLLNEFK